MPAVEVNLSLKSTKESERVECGEKETRIDATINCKVRWSKCKVRINPRSRESVQVSEWEDVARDDVDADVEAAKIALPSKSDRLLSHWTSWMSERGQVFQKCLNTLIKYMEIILVNLVAGACLRGEKFDRKRYSWPVSACVRKRFNGKEALSLTRGKK